MSTAAALDVTSSTAGRVLYLAFELSKGKWKLGFTIGAGQKPREVTIDAGDFKALASEVQRAKKRFGLDGDVRVVSCFEAGRDGLWLDRYLRGQGIDNRVVDSSSIEVNRRARRAKSDGMDVRKLLALLIRYERGEQEVWSVLRVPTVEEEDGRQLHRELHALNQDRVRHVSRIKGLLATHGLKWSGASGSRDIFEKELSRMRQWDGRELPPGLRRRLCCEYERLELVNRQIRELEAEQRQALRERRVEAADKIVKLMKLRGIGQASSWLYTQEFFGWRKFQNRRQVASLAGLVPTPYQSGETAHEQGVSKAGNARVRWMAVEIAWCWLRFQPRSELSRWYGKRFGRGGSRQRRVGIVALARKLLIALWRYVEFDVLPAGAELKA